MNLDLHRHQIVAALFAMSLAGYSSAESVVVEEVPINEPAETVSEKAAGAWDATKQATGSAAEYSMEKGTEILDASKAGVAKGADYVGTKSSQAWDATRKGTAKAVDATSEAAGTAWSKTKEFTNQAVEYTSEKVEAAAEAMSSDDETAASVEEKSVN